VPATRSTYLAEPAEPLPDDSWQPSAAPVAIATLQGPDNRGDLVLASSVFPGTTLPPDVPPEDEGPPPEPPNTWRTWAGVAAVVAAFAIVAVAVSGHPGGSIAPASSSGQPPQAAQTQPSQPAQPSHPAAQPTQPADPAQPAQSGPTPGATQPVSSTVPPKSPSGQPSPSTGPTGSSSPPPPSQSQLCTTIADPLQQNLDFELAVGVADPKGTTFPQLVTSFRKAAQRTSSDPALSDDLTAVANDMARADADDVNGSLVALANDLSQLNTDDTTLTNLCS
jgi:hypothetical protein